MKKISSTKILPFDRGDWQSFNGATPFDGDYDNMAPANQPLIAYLDVEFDPDAGEGLPAGKECTVSVVGDSEGIAIDVSWDDFAEEAHFFMNKKFRTQADAKAAMERAVRVLEAGDLPRGFN